VVAQLPSSWHQATNCCSCFCRYSALFGEYEDFREDMRNKKMLKKKKT
jgi:hypothetical protein